MLTLKSWYTSLFYVKYFFSFIIYSLSYKFSEVLNKNYSAREKIKYIKFYDEESKIIFMFWIKNKRIAKI